MNTPTTPAGQSINWNNVWIAKQWEPTLPQTTADEAWINVTGTRVELAYIALNRPWHILAAYVNGQPVVIDDALDLLETTD